MFIQDFSHKIYLLGLIHTSHLIFLTLETWFVLVFICPASLNMGKVLLSSPQSKVVITVNGIIAGFVFLAP